MKAISSKSESKKRKRDDSQEPITESPKKAKVHAQRKFAQGAAFNSPVITPIKDKVRPPAAVSSSGPILTGKCPNTEDFLTFLCFRRTSILPEKLDFFKDALGTEAEPSPSADRANHKSSNEQTGKQTSKKADKPEESKNPQIPAVQALRRKYQEQRLAKQKVTNVTRLAQKVKGKNMVRTRSSAVVVEETKAAARREAEKEGKTTGLRSGLKREEPTGRKAGRKVVRGKHLRLGLRSGGSAGGEAETKPSAGTKKWKGEAGEGKTKGNKARKGEGFSDFSSDDNEPLLAVKKPKSGGKGTGAGKGEGKAAVKTRSKITETETPATKGLLRPTRKTKEAAALYMEMITKKLVSPEKSGDEDMSSVDSFPELPNVRRIEQRETEIKSKAFGPKKAEPKNEEKGKEAKKNPPKKSEPTKKVETKSLKSETGKKTVTKKETKGKQEGKEESGGKRPGREPGKARQGEEEKSEQSRPSTRSRQQELAAVPLKKPGTKGPPKKIMKLSPGRETEKRGAEVGKKPKEKAGKLAQKKAGEGEGKKPQKEPGRESGGKAGEGGEKSGKQEQGKATRKAEEKKQPEKKEGKERGGEVPGKKGRKPTRTEGESEGKKGKKEEKKPEKKVKKEEEKQEEGGGSVSKRPTRKCSTVDKIWIDLDGFTSDEEDFLEMSSMTKTRASTKKESEKSNEKREADKRGKEKSEGGSSKGRNERAVERKGEERKGEVKKGKAEKKVGGEEGPGRTWSQGEGKKGGKVSKSEEGKGKEEKESSGSGEGGKKRTETKSGESKKRERDGEETGGESSQSEGREKKGEKKKVGRKKRAVEKLGDEAEAEEEPRGGKRTRPVRQCSTGEKRWIETDSDSFSFYETSDEEDNLPIVDFSKKSSPDAKEKKKAEEEEEEEEEKKKNKKEKPPGEEKKKEKKREEKKEEEEEEEEEDNFSESDEEPLKKKTGTEEAPKKKPEAKNVGKTQREVPGLTPLKKPSAEGHIPAGPKPETAHVPAIIPTEPKPLPQPQSQPQPPAEPQPLPHPLPPVEVPTFSPEPTPLTPTDRIEMILHSLKKDKMVEANPSPPNDVKVTFAKVPYQVKATFPAGREPISTHGLDLLSEVALPTTPKENSQTRRIEKWLNESLVAEQKPPRFGSYDSEEAEKTETGFYFGKPVTTPPKAGFSSQSELQKFGQLELLESQKLLKKNVFAADAGRTDQQQQTTPKKAVTSVQDLLKLQKERREVTKTVENVPHPKNCKCNNCVVKKGWFKNKPVPKTEQQKSSAVEEAEESAKPFESLTKALIGEAKNSKMAASVAPMVVSQMPSSSKEIGERKGQVQQRKLSFLERMKERERKEAAAAAAGKQSSKPFSPSNERSVYAFEPEPEHSVGTNTPFRRKTRDSRASSTSASRSDDEGPKTEEDSSPVVATPQKATPDKGAKASHQSASIAVQVNLDSETVAEAEPVPDDGKSIEISTQTEVPEEDSDSPMFYIPLQQATAPGASASSEQRLIQGVALKLGTEGPMGPNQRVIMKAKLVTKPPDSPSMKAVVMPQPKRLFDQKYNNPPIGTVQPTTRKPPDEPAAEKQSEGAKPAVPDAAEADASKGKVSPAGKPPKQKEKPAKQEASDDQSPCPSTSSKGKRPNKPKTAEPVIAPSNSTWLPPGGTPSKLVEAPTFHPTVREFQDPFEFFDRIRPAAEKFGLCRIVPPSIFKPDCKVSDDMRFTAYNQYVHRMFHRWGPNIKEMMAIKKYLATQSISLKQPPWIGGIEVDLPRLYQSVQSCGGLMKVMEKKKWHQVADAMKIPKAAQDRVTKLDDIYCKYLLPYDTLSHEERQKLFEEVEKDWEERQKSAAESQEGQEEEESEENYIEECEECVVKGRNMALNQFYRIARNTMTMWFRNGEPSPREVESEFWRHVSERNHHVCVHSGSIDSSGWGYGFPIARNNTFAKHPWNLKILTNNSGSVLRYLGPVMGVTVPTLHVGMVFTAFCWYRDPHGLPWIEYLHTGAPKIWYGISDDNSTVFQEALTKLLPRYIKNKTIWLPSDTAMIPPETLVEHGVSLCHTVQEPGQFILVFPRAYTSSICTGYLVSESVYFAQLSWLATAEQAFKDIQDSCEPSMFSLEKLLFNIAMDFRSSGEVLKQVLPMVWHVRQKELDGRKTLHNLGLKTSERLPSRDLGNRKRKGRWAQEDDGDYECEVCRTNMYLSLVTNTQEETFYCLPHAIELLTQKRHQLKHCKLLYTYTQEEMNEMVEKLEQRIENKSQKKVQNKPSTSGK